MLCCQLVHSRQQYCSALLNQIQYCSVLSTTMNNVGSEASLNPVLSTLNLCVELLLNH